MKGLLDIHLKDNMNLDKGFMDGKKAIDHVKSKTFYGINDSELQTDQLLNCLIKGKPNL